ncbi:MAG: cytochrome ubiquinol oxidase subunit I [Hydrotalea sp.]|nr:cytochrome ubiquinol oxidase subunit I [Hydrotalea sp.]
MLARIQFAFTVSFHIVFPAMSIGLASFLAVLEGLWLKTKKPVYLNLYKFWVKIFAVAFGLGVVSGVVMSYQFGTNWSVFADRISNVIGPLLGFEVLTAFFLEASFLGIMLFGFDRVSRRMHYTATVIVALGTILSAFWILSANSWMQTPQGFDTMADGRLYPANWLQIVFNPSLPYRFAHMLTAAYLSVSLVVGGVAAFYLFNKRHMVEAKTMLVLSTLMLAIAAPTQLVIGDLHGLNTLKHQPIKVAAMEGIWENEQPAGLRLFALPDQAGEKNNAEFSIPGLSSLILTHSWDGKVMGLKSVPAEDRPPVAWVFWSFRIMVGLGLLMIALGLTSAIAYWRGRLFTMRWLQYWWMAMMPAGFIALLAGWFVTEIGRQPFTVYGVMRTAQSVSPAITTPQVLWSLLCFVVMYCFVFGAGSYYILKLIGRGILPVDNAEQFYQHGLEASAVQGLTNKKKKKR